MSSLSASQPAVASGVGAAPVAGVAAPPQIAIPVRGEGASPPPPRGGCCLGTLLRSIFGPKHAPSGPARKHKHRSATPPARMRKSVDKSDVGAGRVVDPARVVVALSPCAATKVPSHLSPLDAIGLSASDASLSMDAIPPDEQGGESEVEAHDLVLGCEASTAVDDGSDDGGARHRTLTQCSDRSLVSLASTSSSPSTAAKKRQRFSRHVDSIQLSAAMLDQIATSDSPQVEAARQLRAARARIALRQASASGSSRVITGVVAEDSPGPVGGAGAGAGAGADSPALSGVRVDPATVGVHAGASASPRVEEPAATSSLMYCSDSSVENHDLPAAVALQPHHHEHEPGPGILKPSAPPKRFCNRTLKWVECGTGSSCRRVCAGESSLKQPPPMERMSSHKSSASRGSRRSSSSNVSFADQHGQTLCKIVVCANLQYSRKSKRSLFRWFGN